MPNPFQSVAIVGVYNTKQARVLEGETRAQVIADAVRGTLADAGVAPRDVDGVVSATSGHVIRQLGGQPCWSSDAGAGIAGVIDAALAIASGQCEMVLVVGGQAGSYSQRGSTAPWTRPTSEFIETWGLYTAVEFALIAKRHMHLYGTTPESMAEVASAIRSNGATNSEAVYYGREVTPEDVLNSRMVADPFHLLDICMTSEGGAGMLLTTVERARALDVTPVFIHGGALEKQGAPYFEPPVWDRFGWSGRWAGEKAFGMAGLAPSDMDVCEFYDNFSFDVIRLFEAYGFCGEGEGGDFVMDGRVRIDGAMPICTDGGLMSYSHNAGSQALQRPIAGVLQIQGRAANQVPDVDFVLTENYGGAALFTDCLILGREPSA